jgi:hypothetical protein
MNLKEKRTYFACWLLLATYSSKDYLQKQRREREQARKKKKKKKQLRNYKLQSMQKKPQKKPRTKNNTKHKQLGKKIKSKKIKSA